MITITICRSDLTAMNAAMFRMASRIPGATWHEDTIDFSKNSIIENIEAFNSKTNEKVEIDNMFEEDITIRFDLVTPFTRYLQVYGEIIEELYPLIMLAIPAFKRAFAKYEDLMKELNSFYRK